jgi:hypothetical protein
MRLDVVQRPAEVHPASHLWYMDGNDVGCMEELTVPVRRRTIKMLGSMGCGAKNIEKKKEEGGRLSGN